MRLTLSVLLIVLAAHSSLVRAADDVHASEIVDADGDTALLLESELISMHLLPWRQALCDRFVFRPTQNDIVEATNPKNRRGGGGGILMDCLWEQDWRFQELGYKQYQYKIVKNGPDEAQVTFETKIAGWLGCDNSGIISDLLSNLTLKRTVTLRAGQPFFRFDFEFINEDPKGHAKRPSFWVHNSTYTARGAKDTVVRPSDAGLSAIGGDQEAYAGPQAQQFVANFNQGWSASLSKERREGIVYLVDYDYVEQLYNCFGDHGDSGTVEWFYDSILAFKNKPWKGSVYILPIIGLSRVDYANRYFICSLEPKREEGRLSVDCALTSSYESAAKITLKAEIEYDLEKPEHKKKTLGEVEYDGLTIQPHHETMDTELDAADPLLLNISAFVELPDGKVETFFFQHFYTGEYKLKGNRTLGGEPLVKLKRPVRNPEVPAVPPDLSIDRKNFNVFAVHGLGAMRLGLQEAVEKNIPNSKYDIGYCTGCAAPLNGLTDFPYDYERLYGYRALVFANIQDKEFRRIGASILMPYLKAGGGLVLVGGQYAFSYELEEHPINAYYPVAVKPNSLRQGPLQLQKPEVPDHPIFRGIDLSKLPALNFYHDVALKPGATARVLMKAGDQPFLIEQRNGEQITMVVTANPFGASAPGGPMALRDWPEWSKLFANIVRYAGQDLK